MILAVTPNVALDRTLVVPELQRGAVQRPTEVIQAAGGKGLNVARTLRRLGSPVRACGLIGGHTGRLVADLAAAEGLDCAWTMRAAETRVCTMIVEPGGLDTTGLYEVGPPVTDAEWQRLVGDLCAAAHDASAISISGSLPAGVPPAALTNLLETLGATSIPLWVDTSGPALAAAIAAQPTGIKVNGAEAGALLGVHVDTPERAVAAARSLQGQSGGCVVITLGGHGAALVDAHESWWATPPTVPVVSPTGSGDAFLAGLLHSFDQGQPAATALRYAVATGTANAQQAGVARFELAALNALFTNTSAKRLA